MSLSADMDAVVKRWGPLALVGYGLEAFGVLLVFTVLRILPLDVASAVGGWVGRTIGPHLGAHKLAQKHLWRAYPDEFRTQDREKILRRMWDNLGRVMAELPHLYEFHNLKRIKVIGVEHLERLKKSDTAVIFVGGHLGNWEIGSITSDFYGLPMAAAIRSPNNPFVAAMLDHARRAAAHWRMPKGAQGGIAMMRHLKKGGHLGLLVDQKLNEGIKLKFFGRDAMTGEAAAQWALRLNVPMVMVRVKRLVGSSFEVSFEPLENLPAESTPENVAAVMQRVNDKIEEHIRDTPSQWLWMHRRWVEEEKISD